jgi:hypothetical protein
MTKIHLLRTARRYLLAEERHDDDQGTNGPAKTNARVA